MHLTTPHYGREYYEEHRRQGLDYLGHGTWQLDYGRWLWEAIGPGSRDVGRGPDSLRPSTLDPRPSTMLDIGCACGSIAAGLAQAGWNVTGIDLSEHMIAL